MRTTSVSLPTQWGRTTINTRGIQSTKIDQNTKGSEFNEQRPDRDKKRKPEGWLYPKPYSLSVSSTRIDPHCIARSWELQRVYVDGVLRDLPAYSISQGNPGRLLATGGAGPSLLDPDSNLRKGAEIKALLDLKESRVNLGNAFAEHKQTAKFVGDTFTSIYRSITFAKKGKWKKAVRELKQKKFKQSAKSAKKNFGRTYKRAMSTKNTGITNKWLEWKYAVEPLMEDVNGAIFALGGFDQVADWITTVKGVKVRKDQITIERGKGTLHQCLNIHDRFLGYFCRMDFHPGNDFIAVLNNYGVVNPLVPLWEITPWSFVIDWAIPIGEWFEAMDATLGFEFLSGSLTERRETKVTIRENPGELSGFTPGRGPWRMGNVHIRGKQRELRLNRTVYSRPPIPLLPRYKNPLSVGHVANGLSLLVGLMSGREVKDYVRR